jgi:SPP1 family predicted phage head-tail adaptor
VTKIGDLKERVGFAARTGVTTDANGQEIPTFAAAVTRWAEVVTIEKMDEQQAYEGTVPKSRITVKVRSDPAMAYATSMRLTWDGRTWDALSVRTDDASRAFTVIDAECLA